MVGMSHEVTNDKPHFGDYRYQDYVQVGERAELVESDLSEVRHLLMTYDRTHFDLPERIILNSRKILNPMLRLARFAAPVLGKAEKIFSPYNRKVIKAWLAGRWPP